MTYFIKILGCQMNYSDSERIATILEKSNLKPAASIDAAALIVFVTCGVRQSAENRVYGQIHNLRKYYSKKKIILTGCLAHRKDVQRRLKEKVDLFTTIIDFPKNLNEIIHNSYFINPNSARHNVPTDYLSIQPRYTSSYTAYVPIMTGCNNFCTYCVVPYARGRECSRPDEDILNEVKSLVKKGYKEIVLLGQNVNSYKSKSMSFPDLLKLIENIPGKFWLTFLTSHPKDMSDELIKTITKSKKICEYISLPAQSGDDEILRKMNRHYTIAHYKKLVKKIKRYYKKYKPADAPAISTDIIIGFPGETKKQFENTAKLFREMKFDMAYTNQYSPRPETAAWKMKDNVSKKEKVRREKVLTDILTETALRNNKKYIRKAVEVLVDQRFNLGKSRKTASKREVGPLKARYLTHTRTQKKVTFHSNKKIPIGSFQKVKITKARAFGLEGTLL
jgi:tRNA-2-methylthio-N6-dimethylallyladenosine synthase